MRAWAWSAVAVAITLAGLSRARQPDVSVSSQAPSDEAADEFVYDTAARFNERLVGNIDAIDTSLVAVLAGDVAVLVFAVDKLGVLRPLEAWWAITFLAGSLVACVLGYVIGFPRASQGDGLRPRRLVPDLLARPEAAMSDAISDIVRAGEVNHGVRLLKRIAVVTAMIMLFMGATIMTLARFGVPVVP